MATKLGRIVTCGWRNPPSKSCDFLIIGHVTNVKTYVCASAIPMATKLGRVVT